MNLKYAYLCVSCDEVNDMAPQGRCNKCGSEAVYPLSKAVARDALVLPVRADLRPLTSDLYPQGG